ncbi:hypothetical protein DPMN_049261 [Dreissena polymorpha]|uniref:Uncharacterized protein n=1 Tax=Dreissena polymorpha TaxID=45954 RepID=A0A9D4CF98_DREPO|nr:hypothetical protein DPMN_049261 [Dreissena polymorpha]
MPLFPGGEDSAENPLVYGRTYGRTDRRSGDYMLPPKLLGGSIQMCIFGIGNGSDYRTREIGRKRPGISEKFHQNWTSSLGEEDV